MSLPYSLKRRQLLQCCAVLPLATVPLLAGCGEAISACADPDLLSTADKHLRKTLAYVESGADASSQCASCQYFAASKAATCGRCELLDSEVNRRGHCSSWAGRRQSA